MNHELVTSEAVSLDLRPASVVSRLVSGVVDTAIYVLGTLLLLWALSASFSRMDTALIIAVVTLAIIFGLVIVPIAVETMTRGRSVGNLMMGTRIVRSDGGAIRFRHALIRGLVAILEVYMSAGSIAVATSTFAPRAQRLGDLLAGTFALRTRLRHTSTFQPFIAPQLVSWSRTVDLAQLPDTLARRVSALVAQAPTMFPQALDAMSRELYTEALRYVAPRPPQTVPPVEVLRAIMSIRYERSLVSLAERQHRVASRAQRIDSLPFEGA
ncbi:RDD family protein [Haematomicrobium sanguinis]|uniref:RDD family protein n=1 Tax=Haematomicrobium sanguinis TaxID=479106 RepID=UPI0005534227|nr:RDD family protein [Haematomicrobium sanguinis]